VIVVSTLVLVNRNGKLNHSYIEPLLPFEQTLDFSCFVIYVSFSLQCLFEKHVGYKFDATVCRKLQECWHHSSFCEVNKAICAIRLAPYLYNAFVSLILIIRFPAVKLYSVLASSFETDTYLFYCFAVDQWQITVKLI